MIHVSIKARKLESYVVRNDKGKQIDLAVPRNYFTTRT